MVGRPSQMTDADLLEMLDMRDRRGWTGSKIAAAMERRTGRSVSRSAVIAAMGRIDTALELSDRGDPAPLRHDATLAPGWWREGIANRADAAPDGDGR